MMRELLKELRGGRTLGKQLFVMQDLATSPNGCHCPAFKFGTAARILGTVTASVAAPVVFFAGTFFATTFLPLLVWALLS
jgi:hypothetical protein